MGWLGSSRVFRRSPGDTYDARGSGIASGMASVGLYMGKSGGLVRQGKTADPFFCYEVTELTK